MTRFSIKYINCYYETNVYWALLVYNLENRNEFFQALEKDQIL